MKFALQSAALRCALGSGLLLVAGAAASGQVPVPVAEAAIPVIINTIKPHREAKAPKLEGTVMNANIAQITVRAKDNELSIQTFTLTPEAASKMQQIIDKGGYQYGDRVTIFYDPDSRKALKVKGKPSKAS